MDDNEYYSAMNKMWHYNAPERKKTLPVKKWTNFQGREDAEMLYEKQKFQDDIQPETDDSDNS